VGETTATLQGALDPNGTRARAHFEYLTEAEYIAAGGTFSAAKSAPAKDITVEDQVKGKGTSEAGSAILTDVSAENGSLVPGQTIKAPGVLPADTTITSVQADPAAPGKQRLVLSKSALETKAEATFTASGAPQPISTSVEGLAPQTKYILRLVAERTNGSEQVVGPVTAFYTLSSTPTFPDCPANEPFRSGVFAPFGHPSDALPDCRAYEQASPVGKDGGDVLGVPKFAKAADDGNAVTFGSSFGIPGGEGAQTLPFFAARRGAGGSDWSTQGLLPGPGGGQQARFMTGWLPDLSLTLSVATRSGPPREQALFATPAGDSARQVTAYRPVSGENIFTYAGASKDGRDLVIEAITALPATPDGSTPIAGSAENDASNVYAWDRDTDRLHLVSVMNTGLETETLLPRGAFAGPYDWAKRNPNLGGAKSLYYTQEERAVSEDGSVFFTAAGSGQIYQRLNPTADQSQPGPDGYVEDGHCFEPAKACTIHISATHKDNGQGPEGHDSVGSVPAAFQAASADGSVAYFTSSEKLTNDANTGPEQPPAQIGRATIEQAPPEAAGEVKADFLLAHATGIAIDPGGQYIYWADPNSGYVGRARLEPDGSVGAADSTYIDAGETEAEVFPGKPAPAERMRRAHSTPRYVAVDSEHVYWTNTGPLGGETPGGVSAERPVDGAGTIGRATISPTKGLDIRPEFITGAFNPQGVAVNTESIYWANTNGPAIGRADLDGTDAELQFLPLQQQGNGLRPIGIALTATRLYYSEHEASNPSAYLGSASLEGEDGEFMFIGQKEIHGIAVDSKHLYWASQGEAAIGRLDLLDFGNGCSNLALCDKAFLLTDGALVGLATGPLGSVYWSANGETSLNPGNDLYRATRATGGEDPHLVDITADADHQNGAEVQGVLGASADGSYVYFVANADLDGPGPAQAGDCKTATTIAQISGQCSLYVWHDQTTTFLARLNPGAAHDEVFAWAQTAWELTSSSSIDPKRTLLGDGGRALLFLSNAQLTGYESRGIAELYRLEASGGVLCVSCNPTGEAPSAAPTLGSSSYPTIAPREGDGAIVSARYFSSDGDRAFFETTESLTVGDSNGVSCDRIGLSFSCQDVYEWEAPGAGTCKEGGPAYSPANQGCLYLISTGTSKYPSFFIDASDSGDDVFFLTRDQLVGQDTDQLQDVYDARVDGGLASQNQPPPVPCENEGCKNEAGPPPQFSAPPQISGPGNPPIKRKPCKPKKGKKSCAKKHKPRHHERHHHKAAKR
jgi:hypothetical protein